MRHRDGDADDGRKERCFFEVDNEVLGAGEDALKDRNRTLGWRTGDIHDGEKERSYGGR